MAIEFRKVSFPPLDKLDIAAPDGAIVGIIGEDGTGKLSLLRLAAGLLQPVSGEIIAGSSRRLIGPVDPLNLSPADVLLLDHALAKHDALVRARSAIGLERLRRNGTTVLMVSHEEDLLRSLTDEIWWLKDGKVEAKGDPGQILAQYRTYMAGRLRRWGETASAPLAPSMRRGDGRAKVVGIETLSEQGRPTMVWRSGERVMVRVTVRFEKHVANPVVGIMIRTRIGFEVYGTNTELEKLDLGPRVAGETARVTFSFPCDLCPQEYTLTAASHDRDGTWHDWLEDAVAFSVADTRYTAGVANLRASARLEDGRA
jgi:lipopolysaccharide transport system ATP-binding protein